MNAGGSASNIERIAVASTLRVLATLMVDILSTYCGGYLGVPSEQLNTAYVRLAKRASQLANRFPEVESALTEFLSAYPNLYEIDLDGWEFSGSVVGPLQARVSEAYAEAVPINQELNPGENMVLKADVPLIEHVVKVKEEYSKAKRQIEQRWLERVEKKAEESRATRGSPLQQQPSPSPAKGERLYDEAHAACIEALIRRLKQKSQQPQPEGTYSRYGERGSIDVFVADGDKLAIYEVWTSLTNLNEALRKLDEKARVFPDVQQRDKGQLFRIVTAYLVLLATKQNCDLVLAHAETLESRFQTRGSTRDNMTCFFRLALFDPAQDDWEELMPDDSGTWRQKITSWSRFPTVQSFVQAWKRRKPA